jgi:hypothetical protein
VVELTELKHKTGWRYSITATNIGRIWDIAAPTSSILRRPPHPFCRESVTSPNSAE